MQVSNSSLESDKKTNCPPIVQIKKFAKITILQMGSEVEWSLVFIHWSGEENEQEEDGLLFMDFVLNMS